MKPVIKKQRYYNMLLMRDDTAVRTYRVKGSTLRFAVVFFCLLMLGGGFGIVGGLHYWKKYTAVSLQRQAEQQELSEARLQLEELKNVQTIARTSGAPLMPKNEELGTVGNATPRQNHTVSVSSSILAPLKAMDNATSPQAGSATPLSNIVSAAPAASNATSPTPATATSSPPSANATAANAASPSANATAAAASPSANATAAAASPAANATVPAGRQAAAQVISESSAVKISNFQAKATGGQRLRLRYDLISPEQQQIVGQAKYKALLPDGNRRDLDVQPSDGARFSIFRMKPMEGQIRLPQGLTAQMIRGINVILEMDDGSVYSADYPLND